MAKEEKEKIKEKQIAVIRVRGMVTMKNPISDTLDMLKLFKKNHCVLIENSAQMMGMISKVKDYVTYGEVTAETIALLHQKRKKLTLSSSAIEVFALNNPTGGFERKGIKVPFTKGGVLGYRGSKMNDLIKKMVHE
jgi:large subunit ribosomal protein L30